jgi:peptide/nickel transport system permease protein
MVQYCIGRLLQAIVVLTIVSLIVFTLIRLTGDPVTLLLPPDANPADVAALRARLRLDEPIVVQYWHFVSQAVTGDFGTSLRYGRPVMSLLMDRIPNTMLLTTAAVMFSIGIGVPVGLLSAVKPGGLVDRFGRTFAVAGQSMPSFWVALLLILSLGVWLRLLPVTGAADPVHLIMPGFALGWFSMAAITRLTRSAMLDILESDYIRMLRLKGMPEALIIWKHGLKNAAIPVLTLFSIQLVGFLSGAVIIENIFAYPGLGRLVVEAVNTRDFGVVQAAVFLTATLYVLVNLSVDVAYAFIDPRIRR